jgi:tetratricopeptide (TPR) repeat protein
MGERFLYLPSVGFAVVAALFLCWLPGWLAGQMGAGERSTVVLTGLLAFLVVGALSVRTYWRNFDWQDELSLWRSAVQNSPNSFKTYKGYSNAIWAAGLKDFPHDPAKQEESLDHAIAVCETGLRVLDSTPLPLTKEDNTLYQDLSSFYRIKGDFLRDRQQPEEAQRFYQKSLAVILRAVRVDRWVNEASHQSALARGRAEHDIPVVGNYRIYIHLEQTNERLKDWEGAEQAARHIELLNPSLGLGYRLTGTDLFNQGNVHAAIIELLEAGLLDNGDNDAWQAIASCYSYMGLPPSTLRHNGSNNVLDVSNPIVKDELNSACVALVQKFTDAKQFDNAGTLRDKFVKNFNMPAESFPQF